MLGFDPRAARATWTAAAVVLGLYVLYLVRKTLFVFVLALLFAYLLSPLVDLLDRLLPAQRPRKAALGLAYALFVLAVIFGGIQIGSRVTEQASSLAREFPALVAKWAQPSPGASAGQESLRVKVVETVRQEVGHRTNELIAALPSVGLKAVAIASDLIYVVIVPILAFFFLKDAPYMRRHFLDVLEDPRRRELMDDLLADVHLLLAHYMRALVGLSIAAFTAYTVIFWIMGVRYAFLLGALGGILELIPMLGPLTAGLIILVVGWVSGANVLAVVIFLLVYRMFQDYVLSPYLMGSGVELHPLVILFGVFAGAELAGIPGTFLSVPVLALARVAWVRLRKARTAAQAASAP